MNPPYGIEIARWVEKAYESARAGATVVCLLPARTDTRWWHLYVMQADEIRFVKGRLRFVGAKASAPFPSSVVVFRPGRKRRQHFGAMANRN
jgi:site-specific DNA-methyltransferase (adenine-specific)